MQSHQHVTVHIPGLDVVVNLVHYVTDFVPCLIRPIEDVLVEVHDEFDGARHIPVDVAVTEQQQMSIVWHNESVLCTSPIVVYISSVVCVCLVHDGLRKLCFDIDPRHPGTPECDGVPCARVLDNIGHLLRKTREEPQR